MRAHRWPAGARPSASRTTSDNRLVPAHCGGPCAHEREECLATAKMHVAPNRSVDEELAQVEMAIERSAGILQLGCDRLCPLERCDRLISPTALLVETSEVHE